jgi:hypothetical protein
MDKLQEVLEHEQSDNYVPEVLLNHSPSFLDTLTKLEDLYPLYPFELFNRIIKEIELLEHSGHSIALMLLFEKINKNPRENIITEILNIFSNSLEKKLTSGVDVDVILLEFIYYSAIIDNMNFIKSINRDYLMESPYPRIIEGATLGGHIRLIRYGVEGISASIFLDGITNSRFDVVEYALNLGISQIIIQNQYKILKQYCINNPNDTKEKDIMNLLSRYI